MIGNILVAIAKDREAAGIIWRGGELVNSTMEVEVQESVWTEPGHGGYSISIFEGMKVLPSKSMVIHS